MNCLTSFVAGSIGPYLIKNEGNVVWDQAWYEEASLGHVPNTFEELKSWVAESRNGYTEAIPAYRLI